MDETYAYPHNLTIIFDMNIYPCRLKLSHNDILWQFFESNKPQEVLYKLFKT